MSIPLIKDENKALFPYEYPIEFYGEIEDVEFSRLDARSLFEYIKANVESRVTDYIDNRNCIRNEFEMESSSFEEYYEIKF